MSVLSEAVAIELAKRATRAVRRAERDAAKSEDNGATKSDESAKAAPETVTTAGAAGPVIGALSPDEVEEILAAHGIPTSATPATPVPLRVTRVHFSGEKTLRTSHRLAAGRDVIEPADIIDSLDADLFGLGLGDVAPHGVSVAGKSIAAANDEVAGEIDEVVPMVAIPFEWTWEPQVGVNGVGSGKNLRGKSTVLNVLMWALSGRCANFQIDTRRWLQRVEVDWLVGGETVRVKFDNDFGHATGLVESVDTTGPIERVRVIGTFDGEDQFEDTMGAVMMSRLRLEEIPVWTVDRVDRHKWPAYASAFTVRADKLDPIVGNVQVIGTRMLQMFVGTDWGPALAATQTAINEVKADRKAAEEKVSAANEVTQRQRGQAQAEFDRIDAAVKAIPAGTPDVAELLAASSRATELAREKHELERLLMGVESHEETVRLQLRVAKARNHTQLEDALAVKFFHQMTPSVCPRCTSKVTPEQQVAEVEKHECSLCAKDLRLDEVDTSRVAAAAGPIAGDVDEPVDDVDALEAALAAAESNVEALKVQITAKNDQLEVAEKQSTAGKAQLAAAQQRRALEIELAKAEGKLEGLRGSATPDILDPVDPVAVAVLEAADKVLGDWMRGEQNPLLKEISADIEKIAVGFGADSLSRVKLGGNGRLDVLKGADETTYTGLTDGEKLRVKIAAAVAIIKHGYVAQIGRHPGFLVLDSPAAEEMPEEDLAILMAELVEVAEQADMQIFVGTRNAGPLLDLLPEASRRVATGEDYLW